MKIGIVTWFHYHNYGTALQVTALSRQLTLMGCDPVVVNYIPNGKTNTIPTSNIINEYTSKIFGKLKRVITREKKLDLEGKLFDDFYTEHLDFTSRCNTMSDLQSLNKEFDYFVCGSDQVWSPACFDAHYYLDFVSDASKKVAYAPSMGVSSIEDKYVERRIGELAKQFKSLSTREESGSTLISQLVDRPVETVLDPTLLIKGTEWENYCDNDVHQEEPYVLAYFLGNNEQHWKGVYRIANTLGMKVRVIPIYKKDLKRKECVQNAVGPKEFLSLIRNASYVCTDSFHGTVFAINFHKNFCTFERFKNTDKLNQNSRIHNILKILQLENHLYGNPQILDEIDYQNVENRLEELRTVSIQYLERALQKDINNRNNTKRHIYQYNSLCCGCGACASVCSQKAIRIERNSEGFYEAIIDEDKCISCGKCQKVCSFQSEAGKNAIRDGEMYSYKDKQHDVLMKSSSGGIAYRISDFFLKKGYSIVGCIFDKERQEAKHIVIDPQNKEILCEMQGSKYMQSNFSGVIKEIQKRENPIVIFGTPCQIAGARKILADRKDVIYIELICHGVPSYLVYKKYQRYLNEACGMNTKEIKPEFRYKEKGWRNKYMYVTDSAHSICNSQEEDYYLRVFEQSSCYSKTCYECRWRTVSDADLRIGDYWGGKFDSDNTGVSMVISLTEMGKKVLEQLEVAQEGIISQETIQDYGKGQQIENSRRPTYYEEILSDLENDSVELKDIVDKYIKPFEDRKKQREKLTAVKRILRK